MEATGFFTPPRKNNVGPLRADLMLVSDVTPPISDRPRHAEYEGKYAHYEGKYALLLAERGYFDLGAKSTGIKGIVFGAEGIHRGSEFVL